MPGTSLEVLLSTSTGARLTAILDSPGRFFAVMQMKLILANIIVHYDLKLGGDGNRPKETFMGFSVLPARDGVVLFRKRRSGWLSQAL